MRIGILSFALSVLAGCSLIRSSDDFFVVDDLGVDVAIDAFDGGIDMAVDADMAEVVECMIPGDCPSVAGGVADCVDGRCIIGSCIAPFEDCNGELADGCEVTLGTEAACAACGDGCAEGELCGATGGVSSCGTDCRDLMFCTDTCADLTMDIQNCGGCGAACPMPDGTAAATCMASACGFVCDAGREDCDEVPDDMDADGCETDIVGDVNNCGGCGTVCESDGENIVSLACVSSMCAVGECADGFGDCNGMIDDGCELPTDADMNNCGGCGIVCPEGSRCEAGSCLDVYIEVSLGVDEVCARRTFGVVECWGRNFSSSLNGDGPVPLESPTALRWTPPGASEETLLLAQDIAVSGRQVPAQPRGGGGTFCFISDHAGSEGQVFCAGDNAFIVAGRDGGANWPPSPIQVDATLDFVELTMGAVHGCARTEGGDAYCWGSATFGATGTVGERFPRRVEFDEPVQQLALSVGATCARLTSGEVHCIGRNNQAELGRGSVDSDANPAPEPVVAATGDSGERLTDVIDIVGGEFDFCARQSSGRMVCWGRNFNGTIVDGPVRQSTPVEVATDVEEMWLPDNTICWRTTAGNSFCRGRRIEGQFGGGPDEADFARAPVATPALDRFERLVGGDEAVCGFDDLDLHCWGYSGDGEIPQPSVVVVPPAPFVDVTGRTLTNVDDIDLGDYGGCARSGTNAFCWGLNRFGAMASRLLRSALDPAEPLVGDHLDVSMGDQFACGIRDGVSNALFCWGRVFDTSVNFNAVEQPTFINPVQVDVGTGFACTRTEGTGEVFCAGINDDGQVGVSPSDLEDEAEEVLDADGDLSGSVDVQAGGRFACALRGDGRVTCWGAHDQGQLGRAVDGGFADTASAGTVDGIANASAIATGEAHACAIDDGVVKCWGAGAEGQLGNGTRADTFTPAEIRSAGSNAVSVASAGNSTCAAFDSGQVRCWGENQLAQRGEEGDGFDVPILVRDVESQRVVSGPNANGYCARIGDGSWLCWGSNRYGLLGTVPSLIFEPTLVEPTEL
ncbi:MAG: hypothetical protein AAF938_02920 [Myxococcota bacterium]